MLLRASVKPVFVVGIFCLFDGVFLATCLSLENLIRAHETPVSLGVCKRHFVVPTGVPLNVNAFAALCWALLTVHFSLGDP